MSKKQIERLIKEKEIINLVNSMLLEFDGAGGASGSSGEDYQGFGGSSGSEGSGAVPEEFMEDPPIDTPQEKDSDKKISTDAAAKAEMEKAKEKFIEKDDLKKELGYFATTAKMLRGFFSAMVEDIERASFYDNRTTYEAIDNVDIAADVTGRAGRQTVINQSLIKYYYALYSNFNPSTYGCDDQAIKLNVCNAWGTPIFNASSINPKILNIMKSPNAINVFLKGAKDRYKHLEKMALKRVNSPDSSTPEDPDFVFEQGSYMGMQPELGALMNPDPEVRKLGTQVLLKQAEILGINPKKLLKPRQKDYMRLYRWFKKACKISFSDQGVGNQLTRVARGYGPNQVVEKYLLVSEADAETISKHAHEMLLHPELFLICCLNSWHSFAVGDKVTRRAMEQLKEEAELYKREVSSSDRKKASKTRRNPKKYKKGWEGFIDALMDEIPGVNLPKEYLNLNQPTKQAWLSDYRISKIIDTTVKKQYKRAYLDDMYKYWSAKSPRQKEKYKKSLQFHTDLEFYNKLSRISPSGDLSPSRLRWIERELLKNKKIKQKQDPNRPIMAELTTFFIVSTPEMALLSRIENLARTTVNKFRTKPPETGMGKKTWKMRFKSWRIPLLWFAAQMAFYFTDPINKMELKEMLKKFDETTQYLLTLAKRKFKENQNPDAGSTQITKIQNDFEKQLKDFLNSPLAKAAGVTREQALKLFFVQVLDYKGNWTGAYKLASIDDEGRFKEQGQFLGTKWNDEDLSSAGDPSLASDLDQQDDYEVLYRRGIMSQDDYDQIDAPGMGGYISARHSADPVDDSEIQTWQNPPAESLSWSEKYKKFKPCFDPKTYDPEKCLGYDPSVWPKDFYKWPILKQGWWVAKKGLFNEPIGPLVATRGSNTKISREDFEAGDSWQPENPNDLHTMHSPMLRKPRQFWYKDLRSTYSNLSDQEFEERFGDPLSDKYQGPMNADDAPEFVYKPFYSLCSSKTMFQISDEEIENSLPWVLEKAETDKFVQMWKSSFDELNVEVISAVQEAYLSYSSQQDDTREIIEKKLELFGELIQLITVIKAAAKDYTARDLVITSDNICDLLYTFEESRNQVESLFKQTATPDTMLVPALTPGAGEAKIDESYDTSRGKGSNYNMENKNNTTLTQILYTGDSDKNMLSEILYSGGLIAEQTQQEKLYFQKLGHRIQAYENFNHNVTDSAKASSPFKDEDQQPKNKTQPSKYNCQKLLRVFQFNEVGARQKIKRRRLFNLLRTWTNNNFISLAESATNKEESINEYRSQFWKDSSIARGKYEDMYSGVTDRDGVPQYFGKGSMILNKKTPFYDTYIVGFNNIFGPGINEHINAHGTWIQDYGSFQLQNFDEIYQVLNDTSKKGLGGLVPKKAWYSGGRSSRIEKLIAKYSMGSKFMVPTDATSTAIEEEIKKVRKTITLAKQYSSHPYFSNVTHRANYGLKAQLGSGGTFAISPAQITKDIEMLSNLEVYLKYLQTITGVRKLFREATNGLAAVAKDNNSSLSYYNTLKKKAKKIKSKGWKNRVTADTGPDHEKVLGDYLFALDVMMRIDEHYRIPE